MKIVAFNGSPRKGGNTEIMLKTVLAVAEEAGIETEIVSLANGIKRGCTACGGCRERGNNRCVFNDDIINTCIEKMLEADAILLGSPVYFSDLTAEMKALIDRAGFPLCANRTLQRKIGASVAVHRRGGAVHTFDSMNHFFQINGMIIPGSTYWNFGVGLAQGDVANDEEALANMRNLGENIVWLLRKIHA